MIEDILEEKIADWEDKLKRETSNTVFEEIPVPLDEFLYGSTYLNLVKLSDKQYDFILHGTQIYNETELCQLDWKQIRRVGELVAWWGKGGGKDFVSAIIQTRIAYQLLCLNNPQRYFNQADISSIDMLNMAYNSDQAEQVFFKTFAAMIESCRWLSDKCEIKSNMIQFDKRIAAYSGNSFEEAFEGKNLIVAVLDEIAAFKTKIEVEVMNMRRLRAPRYSAESVYDMAKSSIESRFGNGIGKLISLSFSRFRNDYIQQLHEVNKNEPTAYVSFGATWEVNPYKKRSDFDDEFRKNPERAEARYACNPSSVEDGYFRNKEAIYAAFPIFNKEQVPTTDDRFPQLKPFFNSNHTCLCSVHLDLGLKHDKAGLCISHISDLVKETRTNQVGERIEVTLPVVMIDLLTSFIAPVNGEIDFSLIRKMIADLLNRGFKIGKLTCDTFQSADFLQIINKLGIETDTRSVDRNTEAYDCLKELIYDGRLKGYSYLRNIETAVGTVQHNEIIEELTNLILIGGKKVDHPNYSSKDTADALAGSVQGALEIGYSSFDQNSIIEGQDTIAFIGSDIVKDREYLTALPDEYFSG